MSGALLRRLSLCLLSCVALGSGLLGCGGKPQVQVRPLAPARAPTPPDRLQTLIGARALPPGFFYVEDPSGQEAHLHTLSAFPRSGDAHQILGAVLLQGEDGLLARRTPEIARQLDARAAAIGANTLFLPAKGLAFGYALWLSEATPTPPSAPDDALKTLTAAASGWTPHGEPEAQTLESTKLTISAEPGMCYQLAVALSPEARWSELASRGIFVVRAGRRLLVRQHHGRVEGVPLVSPTGGRYAGLHGFTQPLGCFTNAEALEISLVDRAAGPPGSGAVRVQVLKRPR